MVVARTDVKEHLSEEAARRLVEEGVRDGGIGFEQELERMAEALVGGMLARRSEAVEIVARALVEGRLVAVALREPLRTLAGVEVTDLRALGGREVVEPLRPREPLDRPLPPAHTWLSFEVVDDRGVPAHGRYRIALDARVEEGELDERRHRFGELHEAVQARVLVEDLRWDDAAPRPAAPFDVDEPRPGAERVLSIELVDERDQPLRGRLTLTEGDERLAEGELVHRFRRALPEGGPVTLALFDLRPTTEPR